MRQKPEKENLHKYDNILEYYYNTTKHDGY